MNKLSTTIAVVAASIALMASACAASTTTTDTPTGNIASAEAPVAADETSSSTAPTGEASDEPVAAPDDAADSPPTPEPTPEPSPTPEPVPLLAGATTIVSTTPSTGGGPNPTLSWESVDQATLYQVIVLDEAGLPYWSWNGPESSIKVPGGGPTIEQGYSWSVTAFDATDSFLAISPSLPIGP